MTSSNIFNDPSTTTEIIDHNSINLNSLYSSHLWKNSQLRKDIINAPCRDKNLISYCYTCKGKIRKYEVKCQKNFTPYKHSTPNKDFQNEESLVNVQLEQSDKNTGQVISSRESVPNNIEPVNVGTKQYIPSISQQIDSSFREKYISYESEPCDIRRHRLSKNLRGFGCLDNFTSTHSPFKKRTRIQACSISIMIVAIVIISLILVNFTNAHFKNATSKTSTTVVPITYLDINETSAITNIYSDLQSITENYVKKAAEEEMIEFINNMDTETTSISVISKIRKNIRTYPKDAARKKHNEEPKDANMLPEHFCSCQSNQICMLDENSGTSVCRKPLDINDPTGCGGLCALEIEACHLVDKTSGVRVCRLLTVTCSPHEWRCRNGLCVPIESRCNGSIQCYDRSDEMNCDCDLRRQFQCGHSLSCFPKTKLCDGVIDCWDGYDEINCTTECPKHQFTCTNGQCILSSRFCDGFADCEDRSDEPDGCGGKCGANEIPCNNHRCVPRTVLCDGHDNCGDATDELNCSKQQHSKKIAK